MKILIVGQGRLIYFLGQTFLAKNYQLTILNPDEAECRWLARRMKAIVVLGDGTDPRLLEEVGAETMDAVVALTPRDEDNLAVCQLAKHHFAVPRTLALVNDPAQEEVFHQLGVSEAFSITRVVSKLIEQRIDTSDIVNLLPIGEGKVNLTELALTDDSPAIGRILAEIALPADSLVACVFRGEETIIPRGNTRLLSGDRLVVLTRPGNHGQVIQTLTEN